MWVSSSTSLVRIGNDHKVFLLLSASPRLSLPMQRVSVSSYTDCELQVPKVLQNAGTRYQNECAVGGISLFEELFLEITHPTLGFREERVY